MIAILTLVFFSELCNAIGQTFFKKSANTFELPADFKWNNVGLFFKRVFSTPWIWLGLLAMTVGLGFWLFALSRRDLSYVYPIGSVQYIMILLSARFFLKEKVDRPKIIGTILVIIGIALIAKS